jgi:diketogulonate reductase-like aldo/keto reductase
MTPSEKPSQKRLGLNNGDGEIPALGFGTLVSDSRETRNATGAAVEVGFRHLDCAERYRNEEEVGAALKELLADGTVRREDLFVTTKLWNNNHRPERVKPALQASLNRLGLDVVDLYLVHTPFAFEPGDDQDPRGPNGAVVYDDGVTLEETWTAMETLVDEGLSRAIGLSDIDVEGFAGSSIPPESSRRSWRSSRTRITRKGTPRILRDCRHHPVGIRSTRACAGAATARRPLIVRMAQRF